MRSFKDEVKWERAEFFASKTSEHELPVYAKDKNYLARAKEHFDGHDYKAAVIYLRTHFEKVVKNFCDKHGLSVRYQHNAKDLKSEDFWQAILKGHRTGAAYVSDDLARKVEEHRKLILNKLSHAEIVNIFRGEVDGSIKTIEQLESILTAIPRGRAAPPPAAPPGAPPP